MKVKQKVVNHGSFNFSWLTANAKPSAIIAILVALIGAFGVIVAALIQQYGDNGVLSSESATNSTSANVSENNLKDPLSTVEEANNKKTTHEKSQPDLESK